MHVVAAGVHDGCWGAVKAGGCYAAGVGERGGLEDREGVHVSAEEDGWARAVGDRGGEAVAAYTGVDFERGAQCGEVGGAYFRCLFLAV